MNHAIKALKLIAACGCERIDSRHYPTESCRTQPGWSPYERYADDLWCAPCTARAGLDGTLPPRTTQLELEAVR